MSDTARPAGERNGGERHPTFCQCRECSPRKTAARIFAERYFKATGDPVRVHFDHAREKIVIEEPYVHWLEIRLAKYEDENREPAASRDENG